MSILERVCRGLYADLAWKSQQGTVVAAFAARGEFGNCKVEGKVLTIRLPAPEGHWEERKAALAWPSQDLETFPEVRPGTDGEGASNAILVRCSMEEGNQLVWYLNRITGAFLRERLCHPHEKLKRVPCAFSCLSPIQSMRSLIKLMCKMRKWGHNAPIKHNGPKAKDDGTGAKDAEKGLLIGTNQANVANTIVLLYDHLVSRLKQAGHYCIMCDNGLPFPRPWPALCLNDECITLFETTRRPGDLHLLATSPKTAELLVSWAECVADLVGESRNCNLYLGRHGTPPFGSWANIRDSLAKLPVSMLVSSTAETFLASEVEPMPLLTSEVEPVHVDVAPQAPFAWLFSWFLMGSPQPSRPSMDEIPKVATSGISSTQLELEQILIDADSALPATLAWLFSTFKGCLVPLDKKAFSSVFPQQVRKHVRNIQVFISYPSDEKRLMAFRERRETSGSGGARMLFHGAVWPRWHTIARTELKNLSRTHMNVGPSSPSGIFFSEHFELSAYYASWQYSLRFESVLCGLV